MHQNEIFQNDPASVKPFESDTQKIVRKHLQDKNHVITEEEIRNVRVGMTPQFNAEPSLQNTVEKVTSKENEDASDEPLTPWDTLEK